MNRLSLRTRIGLFFLALLAGCVLLLLTGLLVGYQRSGGQTDASGFVIAGLIAGFGMAGLIAGIWYLFDENVARAIENMAAEMRSRAHTDVSHDIDPAAARYLGDLGPAACAISERVGKAQLASSERVAAETAQLESDRGQLAALLSEIPLAVLLFDENYRITLYDSQAGELLESVRPVCLGRSVFDYLERDSLEPLCQRGESSSGQLLTVDGERELPAEVKRRGEGGGFLLLLNYREEPEPVSQAPGEAGRSGLAAADSVAARTLLTRSLVFDFSVNRRNSLRPGSQDVPLGELVFVVFDTETTGLDPQRDEIVQIGAVRVFDGRVIEGEEFATLVNPGRAIPAKSTVVHRISDDMVQCAPGVQKAVTRFAGFAEDAVLVAHNAPFDMQFLHRAAKQSAQGFSQPVLDTVLLAAEIYGTKDELTLDALAARLDVQLPQFERHTALGDAKATAGVLIKLLQMLMGRGIHTLRDAIVAQQRHHRLLPDLNTVPLE